MTLSAREAKLQGLPSVETVAIDVRKWRAMRRQMVRTVLGWQHAGREAERILETCRHADGCPAVDDKSRACLPECPDRENFLSASVIARNAEQLSANRHELPSRVIGDDYRPPPREYFDAIVSDLEILRESKDLLSELEAALAKNAVVTPWDEAKAEPMEKPRTRLLPPQPELSAEPEIDLSEDEEDEQS